MCLVHSAGSLVNDVLVALVVLVPLLQVVAKTVEIPQLLLVAQVPHVQVVEKTVEIPQLPFDEKIVVIPGIQTVQGPWTECKGWEKFQRKEDETPAGCLCEDGEGSKDDFVK